MSPEGMRAALQFAIDNSETTRYRVSVATGIGEGHLSRVYNGQQGTTPSLLGTVGEALKVKVEIVVTCPAPEADPPF